MSSGKSGKQWWGWNLLWPDDEALNHDDPRYPRKTWFRVVGLFFSFWWLIFFAIYIPSAIFNILSVLSKGGLGVLMSDSHLAEALLLDHLLLLWNQSKWLVAPPIIGLVFLILLGHLASKDRQREQKVLSKRSQRAIQIEIEERMLVALASATHSLAQKEAITTLDKTTSKLADQIGERLLKSDSEGSKASYKPPFDEALLPKPEYFEGRKTDLEWILDRLRIGGVTSITALRGMGGIGKTALAAVAVRQMHMEGRFRDGIAVVLCQNLNDPTEVVQQVLTRFDPQHSKYETNDVADLTEVAHKLLDGKDVLIVLDNIEPDLAVEKVIAPLHATRATILLTSRHMLSRTAVSSEGSRMLELLSSEEALSLFMRSLGRDRAEKLTAIEHVAAEQIVAALDRHTLAVKLAGAYAANVNRDLDKLAQELKKDPLSISEGETPRAVVLVFARSIQALPTEAQRLFIALAAFATAEVGRQAVIALGKALQIENPEAMIDLLVLRALVETFPNDYMPRGSDRERLRLHPLLRAFANYKFMLWPEHERNTASGATVRYYADYTSAIQTLHSALTFDERNINGSLEWAHEHEQKESVVSLCLGMQSFWCDCWRTAAISQYLPWGIAASSEIDKATNASKTSLQTANLTLANGKLLWRLGKIIEAEKVFKENLAFRREMEDRRGECDVLGCLGNLCWRHGQIKEAEHFFKEALAIAHDLQNRREEGDLLRSLGRIARDSGQLEKARKSFDEALKVAREVRDQRVEGRILYQLGLIAQDSGEIKAADMLFEESLKIDRVLQNRREEGSIIARLAYNAWQRGEVEKAENFYRDALKIYREVKDRLAIGWALRFLGDIVLQRGKLEEAEGYLQEALAIALEAQDQRNEGIARASLGNLAQVRMQPEEAERYYKKALSLARKVKNRRCEGMVLGSLGNLARICKQLEGAEKYYRDSLEILYELKDMINYANVATDFGTFLIIEQSKAEEGCSLLMDVVAIREKLELPGGKEIGEMARRLGCR